jgi:hypothetical protein
VPDYAAMPCRATPRGARSDDTFSTTAVNLRQIEFGEFGSGSAKNTRWARTTFLRNCNTILYQLRHAYLMINLFLTQTFLYCTEYYTIPYYTILYYTILVRPPTGLFYRRRPPQLYATHRKSGQRRKRHCTKYTGLRPC